MESIYVSGDSFTDGLYFENVGQPRYNAWSYVVANSTQFLIHNDAIGGGSNYRIVRKVFENVPKNNFVHHIIGFTSYDRVEIPGVNGYTKLTPWCLEDNEHMVESYYKTFYDEYWMLSNFLDQIIMLQNYFVSTGKQFYFFNCFPNRFKELETGTIQKVIKCTEFNATRLYNKFCSIDKSHWVFPISTDLMSWMSDQGHSTKEELEHHYDSKANIEFASYLEPLIR